jgi:hypothetical protein
MLKKSKRKVKPLRYWVKGPEVHTNFTDGWVNFPSTRLYFVFRLPTKAAGASTDSQWNFCVAARTLCEMEFA